MKKLNLIALIVLATLSFTILAHKDHGQVSKSVYVTQEQAMTIALKKVKDQIDSNELDSSWSSVSPKTAILERVNGRQNWKITFNKLESTNTKSLNVFLTKTGVFISISK